MTALHELPMLGFDVETTGINAHDDRIVTAALVRHTPGQDPQTWQWLLNPGIDIPDGATAVHGITNDHARQHGVDPGVALFELAGLLAQWMGKGFPVVAMNAAYDLTMLEAENRRHQVDTLAVRLAPLPVGPILDPFVLDKHVDTYRKGGRKLVNLAATYGVTLSDDDAHSAAADALAGVQVTRELLRRHERDLRGLSLGGLHLAQAGWRAKQQRSLAAYFDRTGKEHDGCCGTWPVHGSCCAPKPAETTQGALIP